MNYKKILKNIASKQKEIEVDIHYGDTYDAAKSKWLRKAEQLCEKIGKKEDGNENL